MEAKGAELRVTPKIPLRFQAPRAHTSTDWAACASCETWDKDVESCAPLATHGSYSPLEMLEHGLPPHKLITIRIASEKFPYPFTDRGVIEDNRNLMCMCACSAATSRKLHLLKRPLQCFKTFSN